jgi:ParB family chromosome partitioning protein
MVENISVNDLVFDTAQSRVKTEITDSFVESVEKHGILSSLVVRPDGEGKYIIIAGSRRYQAAREAGIDELPCKVVDADDEEAIIQSATENLQREDLTDYEAIRSVTMWFESLEEDLVGENENIECPECGKECEGRQGLKTHIQMKHEGLDNLSDPPYLSESQLHRKIASQTPFGEKTIQRLVKVGKLPEETLWLIKTKEERTQEEQEQVKNKLYSNFTLSTDNNSVVSNKALEVAKFYNRVVKDGDVPKSLFNNLIYKTLSSRDIKSDTSNNNTSLLKLKRQLEDVEELLDDWKGEVEDRVRIANAANGEQVPEPEPEVEDKIDDTHEEDVGVDRTIVDDSSDDEDDGSETKDRDVKYDSWTSDDEINNNSNDSSDNDKDGSDSDISIDNLNLSSSDGSKEESKPTEEKKTILGKVDWNISFPDKFESKGNKNLTEEEAENIVEIAESKGISPEQYIKNQIEQIAQKDD